MDGTTTAAPRVTIAMPVKNEERWIGSALDSLLAQSFHDFVLKVYDNASTDRTAAVVREHMARDPRIALIERSHDIGAIANFNDALARCDTELVMLAGGHDRWGESCLQRLVQALDAKPQAVLAFAQTRYINQKGRGRGAQHAPSTENIGWPLARFNLYMWASQLPIYGVLRTEALRRTGLFPVCIGADQVLLQELAILGQFAHVPSAHFYARQPRARETRLERMGRYGVRNFRRRLRMPHARLCLEITRVAWRAPLPESRVRSLRAMLVASSLCAWIKFWVGNVEDLKDVLLGRRADAG